MELYFHLLGNVVHFIPIKKVLRRFERVSGASIRGGLESAYYVDNWKL